MYKKIVMPLDGSELGKCALSHVKEIALGCGVADVILLYVIEPVFNPEAASDARVGKELIEQVEQEHLNKAQSFLNSVATELGNLGIHAETAMKNGKPAEEIIEFAEKQNADLIIMCTHGRSGVKRWFMGSVAEKVVRLSSVPVLTVSPKGFRTKA